MKKISIYLLCALCFVFSSCTPPRYGLCFYVSPIESKGGKTIKHLNVKFCNINNENESNTENSNFYLDFSYGLNPYRVYNNDYDCGYINEFIHFDRTDFQKRKIKYLDWDIMQSFLDEYKIKITDPNGVYEDYYTPTIRELIEGNEKYSQYTVGGDCDVVFEFILQKRQ